MINDVLKFLRNQLEDYLTRVAQVDKSVSLSNIVDDQGNLSLSGLGLTLVNVEEETIFKAQSTVYKPDTNGLVRRHNPDLKLNLYVLVSCNSNDYEESLKDLSRTFDFFQSKNVFTPQNSPQLPEGIEKLLVEYMTQSFEEQSRLWTTLGSKYLPSALHKVRLVVVQTDHVLQQVGEARQVNNQF